MVIQFAAHSNLLIKFSRDANSFNAIKFLPKALEDFYLPKYTTAWMLYENIPLSAFYSASPIQAILKEMI